MPLRRAGKKCELRFKAGLNLYIIKVTALRRVRKFITSEVMVNI